MKLHKWSDIKRRRHTPEQLEVLEREVEAELLEMDLRELREASGKTQADLAELMKIAQSEVSRMEKRDDHRISTLRKAIEALGGTLEVVARFPKRRVILLRPDPLVGAPELPSKPPRRTAKTTAEPRAKRTSASRK